MIVPTEDELQSWRLHPVSQFVAAAYTAGADRQRAEWLKYFGATTIPADLADIRLELKTREDAYRAFTECTLADFAGMLGEEQKGAPNGRRPTGKSTKRGC